MTRVLVTECDTGATWMEIGNRDFRLYENNRTICTGNMKYTVLELDNSEFNSLAAGEITPRHLMEQS